MIENDNGRATPATMDAAVVQYLQWKGVLSTTEGMEWMRKVTGREITEEDFEVCRVRINRQLEFAHLEIRKMMFPVDGKRYVALVNKQGDDFVAEALAKKHLSSSPEFFKRLMTRILLSGEEAESGGCLSEAEAMKIGRGTCEGFVTKMSLSAQECTSTLSTFLQEGWLIQNPNRPGHYSLGVRAFLEFHDDILQMELPPATRSILEDYL